MKKLTLLLIALILLASSGLAIQPLRNVQVSDQFSADCRNNFDNIEYERRNLKNLYPASTETFVLGSSTYRWGSLAVKDASITGTATMAAVDINSGTVDSLTSLTIANNVDVGNFDIRALSLTADSLTSGRVPFASTNGLLVDDADLTFATDTLLATNITTTGFITVGANASTADFANAKMIVSQGDSGGTLAQPIGIIGEAVANSLTANGFGVVGIGKTSGGWSGKGLYGKSIVGTSIDSGEATGGYFLSTDTHAGGNNVAVYATAAGGADNYSFFGSSGQMVQSGGTEGLPAYSFTNDTDTGLYMVSSNSMGFSVGGGKVVDINSTGYMGITAAGRTGDGDTILYGGNGIAVDAGFCNLLCGTDADRTGIFLKSVAGTTYIWVDGTGAPRWKLGLPTSEANGTNL